MICGSTSTVGAKAIATALANSLRVLEPVGPERERAVGGRRGSPASNRWTRLRTEMAGFAQLSEGVRSLHVIDPARLGRGYVAGRRATWARGPRFSKVMGASERAGRMALRTRGIADRVARATATP